ncbi:MAG TPA: cytochrome P450 [Streptosporangiaceae bacterium]|nr:cytochrome P450 [Streptosporangiaceae bacterium]HEX5291405.1 cytochrome P450 [Streptosporangiaceae bacterium]
MSTVTDQDLLSPELTEDPFAYFARLRAEDPVHWAEANKAWLLTRYDDVVAAYADPRLSSDRVRPLLGVLPPERREAYGPMLETIGYWMVVTDPPAHTRLRKLANHAFRQQRVNAMGAWIGELVDDLLDDFTASGSDDFLNRIAYPLPAAVIARMMGAPQEDRDKFQHWSDELALVAFSAGGEDRASRYTRALAGVRELQEYLAQLIDRRRREPGEDMISLLLAGADEGGDHLDDAELMALCSLILFAGHETTTNLLCNALVALDRHPAELGRLRDDPSLVNRAVEEVLRYEGPIKIIIRWVVADHDRDGRPVKAGDRVFLVQQSANRDAGTFGDPDRFDIGRPTQPLHVGFGRGIHACLGAQLARIEARVALPKILGRLGGVRVLGDVAWRPNIASRAVTGLRVGHG